jgi:hypothetical protein
MADELTHKEEAAGGYDRAFACVPTHFVPCPLRAAHIAPDVRVPHMAAGTGLAAETALAMSLPPMCRPQRSRKSPGRLGHAKNAPVAVEDGQALNFRKGSDSAVRGSRQKISFTSDS